MVPTREIKEEVDEFKSFDPDNPHKELDRESFAEFVEQQIVMMKKHLMMGNASNLNFNQVNNALMKYSSIQLGLISMYNLAKNELVIEKEAYKRWYAEEFIKERDRLNPRNVTATKWYSAKEIEYSLIARKADLYGKKRESLNDAELRVAFFRRLLTSWESHSFTLNTLSKNIQAEISTIYNTPK